MRHETKEVIKMSMIEKLGKMGLPGFRSGRKWKMIIASIGYFFMFMLRLELVKRLVLLYFQ